MNTGNPAPFQSIVHAWQIIEYQRSSVEVFQSDGQIPGGFRIQAVSRRNLKDHSWANQAARIVQHMANRLLKLRVERCRQLKAGSEGVRKWRYIQSVHAWRRWR